MDKRVLVVGTTADYVEIIDRRFPQRAIFITDCQERAKASEPPPSADAELLCDLGEPTRVLAGLWKHLDRWCHEPSGVACFDCESMLLAAFIADSFGLSYPSAEAISACRSKYVCKRIWRQAGLSCPDAELVHKTSDAVSFLHRIDGPAVLKPLTGSGSELIFSCSTEDDCAVAFDTLRSRLANHSDPRMYAPHLLDGRMIDPRRVFVIEEFVRGDEYSCDFVIMEDRVEILRIAKKILDAKQAFGTTLAYVVPAELPARLNENDFCGQLRSAAGALGLDRALCMLDFVVRDGEAFMIELSPRPGGDCLPPLLLKSLGIDILGCTLDFAERRNLSLARPRRDKPLVGVRLFAAQSGEIDQMDSFALQEDHRVMECHLKRGPGHKVVLPPEDYESRLLGHAIFEPSGSDNIENECIEVASKLEIEMKTQACARVI